MTSVEFVTVPLRGATSRLSLLERWRDLRNRLLASSAFRDWAARFPLTRGIARRQARALFDLCAGFAYSQVLLACVQFDLLTILSDGSRTLADVADQTGLTSDAALRLLDAAVSLRLIERRASGRFALGMLGAALIDNPGVVAMIRHHEVVYRDLVDPVALFRGQSAETGLRRFWRYAGNDAAGYSALMSASQPMITSGILRAYRFSAHRRVMDIGGGEGAFLCALGAKYPRLRLTLFDLPAVAARAAERFAASGLASRAASVGGDFRDGDLPAGADLITLIRVLHDHDDEVAFQLLCAIRAALPEDGTLILAEPLAATPRAEPIGHAYFGLYLLAMGSGRPRTAAEITAMLQAAGFDRVDLIPTVNPMVVSLIRARA